MRAKMTALKCVLVNRSDKDVEGEIILLGIVGCMGQDHYTGDDHDEGKAFVIS